MMHFRPAELQDLPFIVSIYNSTIASRMVTADDHEVSVESRLAWFESFNAQDRPLWILSVGTEDIGWLGFSSFYGRPAYRHTAEISLYLDERFRARGLGYMALSIAATKAPEHQIHVMLAYIFGHNLASLNLFEKAGFTKWGNLPAIALLDGIFHDLVIFGKNC